MESSSSTPEQALWGQLQRRRAELLESIGAVEQALATPGREAHWAERVHVALVELDADFRGHVQITEGPHGLYGDLLLTAPRLSAAVDRLTHDHALIKTKIDDLLARLDPSDGAAELDEVDEVRERATALLARLLRHRQRGSDLIFEAYQAEIGGET